MDGVAFDPEKICRACKNAAPNMRSLFETSGDDENGPRIDEMLMACAAITVSKPKA